MGSLKAYSNCRFYVEISGIAQAVFTEISGLEVETKVEEYEEGGNNGFTHKMPGRTKVSNITLRRGMTNSQEFFKWYLEIAQGKIKRRNISIRMFDMKGEEVTRWDFEKAYPVRWIGPQLVADGNHVAIETLELAHDGLVLG